MNLKRGSLTFRGEHRQKVVENQVLGEIFGRKTEEVTRNWGNLHNENLYCLYSPFIIQVMKSKTMK